MPLIVLTDRPAAGAARRRRRADDRPGQALRRRGQVVRRGRHARRDAASGCAGCAQLACRAFWTAAAGAPGPVHLNFPLREPLVLPEGEELPPDASGRPDGRPWVARSRRARPGRRPPARDVLGPIVEAAQRGVVVLGRHERGRELGAGRRGVRGSARAGRCSPTRCPAGAPARRPIAHYDLLLRHDAFARGHAPGRRAARRRPADLQAAARRGSPRPDRRAGRPRRRGRLAGPVAPPSTSSLAADPVAALARRRARRRRPRDPAWLGGWRRGDELAAAAIAAAAGDELSEPRVALELGAAAARRRRRSWSSASMPIRDVETFFAVARRPAARAVQPRRQRHRRRRLDRVRRRRRRAPGRSSLLIGDVALAHDLGGLLAAHRTRAAADDRPDRQRRRRDLRLPAGRRASATPSRSTSRRRRGWTSSTSPRCSGCATCRRATSRPSAGRARRRAGPRRRHAARGPRRPRGQRAPAPADRARGAGRASPRAPRGACAACRRRRARPAFWSCLPWRELQELRRSPRRRRPPAFAASLCSGLGRGRRARRGAGARPRRRRPSARRASRARSGCRRACRTSRTAARPSRRRRRRRPGPCATRGARSFVCTTGVGHARLATGSSPRPRRCRAACSSSSRS